VFLLASAFVALRATNTRGEGTVTPANSEPGAGLTPEPALTAR
jgi:hypothetical protein